MLVLFGTGLPIWPRLQGSPTGLVAFAPGDISFNVYLKSILIFFRTDYTDSAPISRFYSAQRLDLFARCVRLSRLSVGFRTHSK